MTTALLQHALAKLTDLQREAVEWNRGPLLVLAGPGSGKTQVLTCRIAKLLSESSGSHFRILAMTFTNKAADEMKRRVMQLAEGEEERVSIGTFHGFCADILRQHGVHLGIRPDFQVYSSEADRRATLESALRGVAVQAPGPVRMNYLPVIDRLKALLVSPDGVREALPRADNPDQIEKAYRAYEDTLRELNALDFGSLILEAHKLLAQYPMFAERYRRTYPHVLVDEFQDTNSAQYGLLRALLGDHPTHLVAVADDDQIIYEWNGASFKRIENLVSEMGAAVLQLPTNYRCPAAVVDAANRLVVYNSKRTRSKAPLIAGRTETMFPPAEQIEVRVFDTDDTEADGTADSIRVAGRETWERCVVLARAKAQLDLVHKALGARDIPAVIAQRRDDFLSPEFRWLMALLRQIARPLDSDNVVVLVDAFNRLVGTDLVADDTISAAESSAKGYLETWLAVAQAQDEANRRSDLLVLARSIALEPRQYSREVEQFCSRLEAQLTSGPGGGDAAEDLAAWRELFGEIKRKTGSIPPLEEFLQEMQLRSKEPPPRRDSVSLMTIHAAKGREFDFVYLVGMAEEILPSYQSLQKPGEGAAVEEERRNCFVAITRTREKLILSRARKYRGWAKRASRFLVEMELDQ